MTAAEPEPGPEPLEPGTLVYRQIHPTHQLPDRISAVAFLPSKLDDGLLSTLHGRVGPDEAFRRWTEVLGHESVGSFGVSLEEIDSIRITNQDGTDGGLTASEDGHLVGVEDHVSIDFTGLDSPGRRKQAARKLLAAAVDRGGALNTQPSDETPSD